MRVGGWMGGNSKGKKKKKKTRWAQGEKKIQNKNWDQS